MRDKPSDLGKRQHDRSRETLTEATARLKLDRYTRHVLVCAGPKCVSDEGGTDVWQYLKDTIDAAGPQGRSIFRTKAQCLRICHHGPVAVTYPEGRWYHSIDRGWCAALVKHWTSHSDREPDPAEALRAAAEIRTKEFACWHGAGPGTPETTK